MSDRINILDRIDGEREYQIQRWGTADEEINMPNDFVAYMAHYSTKWFNGQFAPYNLETLVRFNEAMVKTAAIAVAAAELSEKIINGEIDRPDILQAATEA
jgi:hypothetical protein